MYLVLLKEGSLIGQIDTSSGNEYFKWFRNYFLDLSVLKKMDHLVKQQNITIIHTHQFIELFYAVLLKMMNPSIRIVHQIHLLFEQRNWAFLLERLISKMTSKILTVSKSAKNTLTEDFNFPGDHIGVLYNGINSNTAQKASDISLDVDPSKFNIVMVANFVFGKDHETLLKAYDSHIRTEMSDVNFFFIGRETNLSERLRKKYLTKADLLNKRVVFCGSIPNARMFLPVFDLAVMSCFSETFNIALAEAVIAGKQVLASDIPVFRELSEEGEYFHMFETGNPDDFYKQLGLIRQKNLTPIDSAKITRFREKYGFDAFLANLANIYAELN